MKTKTLLTKLGINTGENLMACRDALKEAAAAAEGLTHHRRLFPITGALKGLGPHVRLEFFESAGQEIDDRYRIWLAITGNSDEAKTAIEAFGLGDFDELLESGKLREGTDPVTSRQSFFYHPDDSDSTFREIVDAVTPIYGEFMETSVDVEEFRRDVATLLVPFQKLTAAACEL
jgi:hypothetical protein